MKVALKFGVKRELTISLALGPETNFHRLKRCHPSWLAREVFFWSKLRTTHGERRDEPQETRSLNYWVKSRGNGVCK